MQLLSSPDHHTLPFQVRNSQRFFCLFQSHVSISKTVSFLEKKQKKPQKQTNSCDSFYETLSTPHPSLLFFNHHSASGRLPSRKGSPLPGLPPNPSTACPPALRAAHSPVSPTTCRSAPCHSSPLSCGNIRHRCQSVPASVAKITLSRTLGGAGDVSSYRRALCVILR